MRSTRFPLSPWLATLAFAVQAAPAELNTAQGRMKMDGEVVTATYAYAWQIPDMLDPGKLRTHVLFSDLPLNTNKLDRYQDMNFAAGNMARARGAKFIDVELDPDGTVHSIFPSAAVQAEIGGAFGKLRVPAPITGKGDDGRMTIEMQSADPVRYNRGNDKGEGTLTYTLSATYRFADRTPKGKPLPADGGEPARAYSAFHAARLKGDFAAMARLMDDVSAAGFGESAKDPSFAAYFTGMLKEVPRSPAFTHGLIDGDHATLWEEGARPDGTISHALIYLVRENGAWKVAEENAKD
jgi:hypothetical protein